MRNKKLKLAMYAVDANYKDVEDFLGINTKVFTRKINRQKVNGYECYFKECEKAILAKKFKIKVTEIE